MGKGEISWKGRFADGRRRQVYAKRTAREWRFYEREKRYDRWEVLVSPSWSDWEALLDGVERRVQRRLLPPEEADRIRRQMREQFSVVSGGEEGVA